MAVIFYFSSIPSLRSPFEWDFLYRKLAHMTEYAILALLFQRALSPAGLPSPVHGRGVGGESAVPDNPAKGTLYPAPPLMNERRETVIALALTGLYAVTDEFHQGFVPGRTASVVDVLIDSAGALTGLSLRIFQSKNKP